jgi:hypothetical protein
MKWVIATRFIQWSLYVNVRFAATSHIVFLNRVERAKLCKKVSKSIMCEVCGLRKRILYLIIYVCGRLQTTCYIRSETLHYILQRR